MSTTAQPRPIELAPEAFARLRGADGRRLRVACGHVWITIDGEPDDHLLARGDAIALPPGARVLLQALGGPARVLLHEPARTRSGVLSAAAAVVGRAALLWRRPTALAFGRGTLA